MKSITLPVAELKQALIGLGKVISRKCTLPVLETVRVHRDEDGWVTLTGTDLDSYATLRLESPDEGAATTILVSYAELSKLTKNCRPDESILVDNPAKDQTVLRSPVGNQFASVNVDYIAPEEYPDIPKIEGEPQRVEELVRTSILEAMQCVSNDNTRYILNGACLDVSQTSGHYVVGTDGKHLFSSNSFQLPVKKPVIIPDRKFICWKPFVDDGEWRILCEPPPKEKDEVAGFVQISSRRWTFVTRQIDGNYPNWRQVIPDSNEFKTVVGLTEKAVESALRLIPCMPLENEADKPIRLIVADRKLYVCGQVAGDGEPPKYEIGDVTVKGLPIVISLNRTYVLKALRLGLDTMEFIDALSPVRFSKGGRQIILMPLRTAVDSAPGQGAPPTSSVPESIPDTTTLKERNTAMNTNNGVAEVVKENAEQTEPTCALDQALELTDNLKTTLQNVAMSFRDLSACLKQLQREQKTSTKEMQLFRSRLKDLQALKI